MPEQEKIACPSGSQRAESTPPILEYYNPKPGRRTSWLGITCLTIGILALMWLAASLLAPPRDRYGVGHGRMRCASNMRQIGQAIMLYANENRGAYPDRLEDLLLTQQISSDVFACPFTNDTPSPGATPQAQAANLSAGGHLSYVYLGKGLTTQCNPEIVVLYECVGDYGFKGANFLFAEGHVEFINAPLAQKMINDLAAGQNPPASGKSR